MNKMFKRIATGIATSAMLIANFTPVFAATELQITGNGSDSNNTVAVSQSGSTFVTQDNNTQISNNISVSSDTGSNTAQDNTNGDVTIRTGDATADVTVDNAANLNAANVQSCNSCNSDLSVLVSGNGSGSDNNAALESENATVVNQTNTAHINNDIDTALNTGNNVAEDNTGGDAVIVTGDADAHVSVSNMANMNSASITPTGDGGSVSLMITGNGAHSDNSIALSLAHDTWLKQDNATSIRNDIEVEASTGDNTVSDNTGGAAGIGTGDATVDVAVDNMAGFNTANVEGCCFSDLLAKVGSNGADTENAIAAVLEDNLTVFQDNGCGGLGLETFGLLSLNHYPCFNNELQADALTGGNVNEDGTDPANGDPMILTGDTNTTVDVSNQGGANFYGTDPAPLWDWNWPAMGLNLSLSFDLNALLQALHLT